MNAPYLIQMSDAVFDGIPGKVVPRTVRLEDRTLGGPQATKWIFNGYCEKLLFKNERLQEFLERFTGRLDDPECWSRLTPGQRILYPLAALDGQVTNGGLAQFFWNCPDLIFAVDEALTALGCSALAAAYEKAVDGLIGNKDQWLELRNQARSDPETSGSRSSRRMTCSTSAGSTMRTSTSTAQHSSRRS